MIYEFPSESDPIRQGDIFLGLPMVDIALNDVIVVGDGVQSVVDWRDIAQNREPTTIIVPVRSVAAIVATQDCDAVRSRDITLCEIRNMRDVEGKCRQTQAPKKWIGIITQHARINQKWFYLPTDKRVGFSDKMAVDFMETLRLPREELESFRDLRVGRLNSVADEHFRERIGEFYRRYPYDEWYPLDDEEMAIYKEKYPEAEPYSWQQIGAKMPDA